jgi:hypothetical protein
MHNRFGTWLALMLFLFALIIFVGLAAAQAKGFKVANIHFETNASACDMGIQIAFDTEGVTEGNVRDPRGNRVYVFDVGSGAVKDTGGQTEGFFEGVEPQIKELVNALGCGPTDEPVTTLKAVQSAFPPGTYTFHAEIGGTQLDGTDELTYHIPAGPRIVAPSKGAVLDRTQVTLSWRPVTTPIIRSLGPVKITGYHVIVEEAGSEAPLELNADLPASATSFRVPLSFLRPSTTYVIEVLATEESGNQTITEGFFCTTGVSKCVGD